MCIRYMICCSNLRMLWLAKNIELLDTDLRHSIDAMTNDIDAVIITPEMFFREISGRIQKIVDCRIIMVRDLLEDILLIPEQLSKY